MVAKRLDRLLRQNPLAARIFERRGRGGLELVLDELEAELDDVGRYEIVAALKELDAAEAGDFIVGRKGHKSRFVWKPDPPADKPPLLPRAGVPLASSPRMLEHPFHVRPGVLAKLELPEDITRTEVERLCQFLQAIPFT